MSSGNADLVSGFRCLEGLGVLRQRWLLTADAVIARAQASLADGEHPRFVAVGENEKSLLEGIVLTDKRIGVISSRDVRWFSRADVWEASSISTSPAATRGGTPRLWGHLGAGLDAAPPAGRGGEHLLEPEGLAQSGPIRTIHHAVTHDGSELRAYSRRS